MPKVSMMTKLLNKIERRLGMQQINLPDYLSKEKWATEVIANETLDTFSRYFPRELPYVLGPENKRGDHWLIDEDICESVDIIGVRDIDWHAWSAHYPGLLYGGVNSYDMMTSGIDFETIVDVQMMADHVSAFSNGIYLKFEDPNKIYLNIIISSSFLTNFQHIPIKLLVKHAPNLKTIAESKMETFENLATADVASFLYEQLKMYDGLDTIFSNIDLKLGNLEQKAANREQIVQYLQDNYVSAANESQPIMLTIN